MFFESVMHICFSHETEANYWASEVLQLLHLLSPCFCFDIAPFGGTGKSTSYQKLG